MLEYVPHIILLMSTECIECIHTYTVYSSGTQPGVLVSFVTL